MGVDQSPLLAGRSAGLPDGHGALRDAFSDLQSQNASGVSVGNVLLVT